MGGMEMKTTIQNVGKQLEMTEEGGELVLLCL